MPDLRLKRTAEDSYNSLPDSVRQEIDLALLLIQSNPTEEGTELLGRLAGRRRKRVSGYRIIYRIVDNGATVIADAIGARPNVYGHGRPGT